MAIEDEKLIESIKDLQIYPERGEEVMVNLTRLVSSQYSNNFLFVYGSLRKDEYNYKRIRAAFGKDSFIYIIDREQEKLKLHDLGNYPAAISVLSYSEKVQGQIMYCSDKVFKAIKDMEEGAGYETDHLKFFKRTPYGSSVMLTIPYYKANKNLQEEILTNSSIYPKVESGNWSRYIRGVLEKK